MPNKLKSKNRPGQRTRTLRQPTPRKLPKTTASQLRAAALLKRQIRFIPSRAFESSMTSDGLVRACLDLIESLRTAEELQRAATRLGEAEDKNEMLPNAEWISGAPLLTFEEEQLLFSTLNYALYQASLLRSRLSPSAPSTKSMNEIERLLELADQIRSQLVNSNLRLVGSIARKFSSQNVDVDDFTSDGCTILLAAIDRFDYARGFRFSTYATHSIQRHFYRVWKTRQRRRERFPNTSSELFSEIPNVVPEEPLHGDPEGFVAQLLNRAEDVLDEREREIVLSRFGLAAKPRCGKTLREIAADMGLSKERVRQLQMKAIEKLRQLLAPEDVLCDAPAYAAQFSPGID